MAFRNCPVSPACVRPCVLTTPCTALAPVCVEYNTSPWKTLSFRMNQGETIAAVASRRVAVRSTRPFVCLFRHTAHNPKNGSAAALKRINDSKPAVIPNAAAEPTPPRSCCSTKNKMNNAVKDAAKHSVSICAVEKINVGSNSPMTAVALPCFAIEQTRRNRRAKHHRQQPEQELHESHSADVILAEHSHEARQNERVSRRTERAWHSRVTESFMREKIPCKSDVRGSIVPL